MISLAAVAVNREGKELGDFEINFLPLENTKPHPTTIKWFTTHAPEALYY